MVSRGLGQRATKRLTNGSNKSAQTHFPEEGQPYLISRWMGTECSEE